MKNYIFKIFILIIVIIVVIAWSLDDKSDNKVEPKITLPVLENIKAKKVLDVVILNSPSVYYVGIDNIQGFEYELISDYAKSIGVELKLTVVYTIAEALKLSRNGIGDITVASVTVTPKREKEFSFGPEYYEIQEQLICSSYMHKKGTYPKKLDDLVGLKIVVSRDSSYETTLENLKNEIEGFDFNTSDEFSSEELLEKVYKQEIDCTVADSNIYAINKSYYPKLSFAMALSDEKSLAWVLRKGDDSLKNSLSEWFDSYEKSAKMAELKDFYYSYHDIFNFYNIKVFNTRLKSRLPKYEKDFIDSAGKYNIPWILLAAQSYQESHWNPKAKSYTGVRGMMMLTLVTAKQIGVKNRLDAKESIYGGAKYLQSLYKRFPDEIEGINRWFFALAAYNVGMGHIHDAQVLARRLEKNPNSWSDIKSVLPLLSQKKYYKTLKHGYARGGEPVKYVDSILQYYHIIQKFKI